MVLASPSKVPIPVCLWDASPEDKKSQKLLEVCKDPRSIVRRRHASHITVVLSKAAHSGPSVWLRARAPCTLRVSCPGADRAFVRAAILQAKACSVSCRSLRFRGPLGARHLNILYLSAPPPFSSHISFSRTPFFLCVYLPLRAAYSEGSSRTISLTLTSLPDATKNWRNRSLVIGTMYQA